MGERRKTVDEAELEAAIRAAERGADEAGGERPEDAADPPADAEAPEAASEEGVTAREAALEAEVASLKDQLLRALAEVENIRRRAERDKADTRRYAVAEFARELLTASDNLSRALDSVPEEARAEETVKSLLTGVELTERHLMSVYEKQGIRRLDPLGERFDPNFHQAMFEVPGTGKPAGTVVQVVQPGYVIHDRLLRAALVGVAKSEPAPERVDTTA